MKEQLEKIYENATSDLTKASCISDLDEIRGKYLSRKGEFNEIKKNLKNLSDEDKQVLKLSALMHDFGKKGNVPTKGHASISKKYAESVLENINVKDSVKERVIRHIDNHHWFQSYNQGFLEKDNVINIFPEEGDAAIAKILTKSDFESVKPNFHLRFLIPNRLLTQKEFDFEFDKMMSEIF